MRVKLSWRRFTTVANEEFDGWGAFTDAGRVNASKMRRCLTFKGTTEKYRVQRMNAWIYPALTVPRFIRRKRQELPDQTTFKHLKARH